MKAKSLLLVRVFLTAISTVFAQTIPSNYAATKKVLRVLWVSFLLVCILLYVFYGQYLTAFAITEWITEHTHAIAVVYCFICIIRGLILMPSTPFIFAGILLFPDSPVFLLVISLACILLSSILIFYASYMGFGTYFEKIHPDKIAKIRARLVRPSGFYFIAGWSMLPFTPTDLITYVAGTIKLPVHRLLFPLMLGETVICMIYIFNGMHLMEYIR